jgi:hypothetical protein
MVWGCLLLLASGTASAQVDLSHHASSGNDDIYIGAVRLAGGRMSVRICNEKFGTDDEIWPGVDTSELLDDLTIELGTGDDRFEVVMQPQTRCGRTYEKVYYGVYMVTAAGDEGNDTMIGGLGQDTLWGDAMSCTTATTGGNDRLTGRSGLDRVYGCGGDDSLYADRSAYLSGLPTNAILIGGNGRNCLGTVTTGLGSPLSNTVNTASRCSRTTTVEPGTTYSFESMDTAGSTVANTCAGYAPSCP